MKAASTPIALSRGRMTAAALVVLWAAVAASAPPDAPDRHASTAAASGSPPVRLAVIETAAGDAAPALSAVQERGGSIVAHLGQRRWLLAGPPELAVGVPGILAAEAWRPLDGISSELRGLTAANATPTPNEVAVVAAFAPGSDLADLRDRLARTGAVVAWLALDATPVPQIGFRASGADLSVLVAELGRSPGLVWAEPQAPIRLLNAASVWRCQSGSPGSTPIFDRGVRGEGQVIGILDTGLDIDDCRFDDPAAGLPALNQADGVAVNLEHRKVLAVDFHWSADWPPRDDGWDDHGHGTHVAGSAAGDALGNRIHDGVDGMAPAAKLVIQDGGALIDDCADLPGLGCPVKPLEPVLDQARDQGARIHSNSWGDEENFLPFGRYTERTADVDRFAWRHKDTLVFFAAGNSGPADGTVISPSTGKNVVSVGATLHGDFEPDCVAPFSSRGWSRDGRVKPDVVAPGTSVVSAASNFLVPDHSCGDAISSGTSMATPTAAGLAALVRQYFTDGFYPTGVQRAADAFEPSAALVKAVLIASAVDLSTVGCPHEPVPSRDQGWGLVQLDTVLAFAGDDRGLIVGDHREGFGSAGDEPWVLRVTAAEPGPLKVVLVWTDPPSSSLATTNLVNDLDLTVSGAGGDFFGNAFSGGRSVTGGEADRVNNVEVVWLPDADRGVWTVAVSPHAIEVPDQDFAVVVTGAVRLAGGPRLPSGRVTSTGSPP